MTSACERRRLVFPIERTGHYRTLGPVIAAALAEGDWDVELLLGPPIPPSSDKAYQTTSKANVPERLRDRARGTTVASLGEMARRLNGADAVVALGGRSAVLGPWASICAAPLWCAVFDADHSALPDHAFEDADLAFWPSEYYVRWALALRGGRGEALEQRSHAVGYLRTDPLAESSRLVTRHEWGLPPDRPVVLYVPDGYLLTGNPRFITAWYRHIWCVNGHVGRVVRAVALRRTWAAVREAVSEPGSYAKTTHALRAFCDRNGAVLAVMPRKRKNWTRERGFTRNEIAAADHVITEDRDYPQTLPRAAQMADLVVCGYRSGTLLDALAAGVPYVTVGVPPEGESAENRSYAERFDHEQGHRPGATWLLPARRFIEEFPDRRLTDFAIDPAALEDARARYVGPVDGKASFRLLQVLRSRLRQASAGNAAVAKRAAT